MYETWSKCNKYNTIQWNMKVWKICTILIDVQTELKFYFNTDLLTYSCFRSLQQYWWLQGPNYLYAVDHAIFERRFSAAVWRADWRISKKRNLNQRPHFNNSEICPTTKQYLSQAQCAADDLQPTAFAPVWHEQTVSASHQLFAEGRLYSNLVTYLWIKLFLLFI